MNFTCVTEFYSATEMEELECNLIINKPELAHFPFYSLAFDLPKQMIALNKV